MHFFYQNLLIKAASLALSQGYMDHVTLIYPSNYSPLLPLPLPGQCILLPRAAIRYFHQVVLLKSQACQPARVIRILPRSRIRKL